MSPVRKPSALGALNAAAARPARDKLRDAPKSPPARITLNLPPDLYRELTRWTSQAAEAVDAPRVGVQEALRAMVTVIAKGQAPGAESAVLEAIRDELAAKRLQR